MAIRDANGRASVALAGGPEEPWPVPGSGAAEVRDWRSLYERERERAEAAEARAGELRWAGVRAWCEAGSWKWRWEASRRKLRGVITATREARRAARDALALQREVGRLRGEKLAFARLRAGTRRTALAWELKEAAANLWNYRSRTWALAGWNRWLDWASGCGLEPVVKTSRMIREHLWGIVNAIILRATNGPAEGINSRIKTVKVRSCGFRNRERFANAIYFHLGGLNLYPDSLPA